MGGHRFGEPYQQPMPPCHRCGAAFAAHLDGRCPQAGPVTEWRHWPRRYPLLTGAVMLLVLLASAGIVLKFSQTSSPTTASQVTNGNATACSDYWNMTDTDPYDAWGQAAGWRDLEDAAPGITDPALWRAVQGLDEDLTNDDVFDAGPASIQVGTACMALGYGNPGPTP
jgi:hypothetical protein